MREEKELESLLKEIKKITHKLEKEGYKVSYIKEPVHTPWFSIKGSSINRIDTVRLTHETNVRSK